MRSSIFSNEHSAFLAEVKESNHVHYRDHIFGKCDFCLLIIYFMELHGQSYIRQAFNQIFRNIEDLPFCLGCAASLPYC